MERTKDEGVVYFLSLVFASEWAEFSVFNKAACILQLVSVDHSTYFPLYWHLQRGNMHRD